MEDGGNLPVRILYPYDATYEYMNVLTRLTL
jgi:hypothetical protein